MFTDCGALVGLKLQAKELSRVLAGNLPPFKRFVGCLAAFPALPFKIDVSWPTELKSARIPPEGQPLELREISIFCYPSVLEGLLHHFLRLYSGSSRSFCGNDEAVVFVNSATQTGSMLCATTL